MGVLDQVVEMKNKGLSDQEIVRTLKDQGVFPADITDALSRAQIKNAVSNLEPGPGEGTDGMEPSILGSEEPDRLPTEGDISDSDLTPPRPIGFRAQPSPMYATKEIPGEYGSQDVYYPQQYPQFQGQGYSSQEGYNYSPSSGIADTDTMIEVSEQVFSEKSKSLQKKIDEMNEFRALAQTKIDYISERLKKIESIIDSLQASILEKVGNYGYGLENVKKEMNMMQDSFGKMGNNVADKSEKRNYQSTDYPLQEIKEQNLPSVIVQKSKKTTRKFSKR